MKKTILSFALFVACSAIYGATTCDNGMMNAIPLAHGKTLNIDGDFSDWDLSGVESAWIADELADVQVCNLYMMYDNQCFMNLTSPMESHKRIKKIESTEDTLIGVFKDDKGMDAFMIVNFTDPYFDKDNEVTVQFKDAKALLTYRLGQKVVVDLPKDGSYTFKLYPGEGRFVIPLK